MSVTIHSIHNSYFTNEFKNKSEKYNGAITSTVALKILKNVETKARIKAFFTNRVILIPASLLLLVAGLAITVVAVSIIPPILIYTLKIAAIILISISLFSLIFVSSNPNRILTNLTDGYKDVAMQARSYISDIKNTIFTTGQCNVIVA